jgi:transcriptional regulator with XRE-family HTH domain
MPYSERIKQFREARKMTHQQFANAVGVSRGAVQQWERGTTAPKRPNQPAVAKFMGITVSELMSGEEIASTTLKTPSNSQPKQSLAIAVPTQTAISFEDALRVIAVTLDQAEQSDRNAAKAYLVELCDRPGEVDTFAAKLTRLLAPLPRQANGTNH